MIKKIMYLILLILAIAFVLTFRTQTSEKQKEFLAGKVPESLPDGFWKGSADFGVGNWRGKVFNAAEKTGMNAFDKNGTQETRVPFNMYPAEAIWDKGHQVLRFDYNRPDNPFWLRPALDEVVEVAPGKILGKIHYRIFPGFSIALEYFRQER